MKEDMEMFLGRESMLVGKIIKFMLVLKVVVLVNEMGKYIVERW